MIRSAKQLRIIPLLMVRAADSLKSTVGLVCCQTVFVELKDRLPGAPIQLLDAQAGISSLVASPVASSPWVGHRRRSGGSWANWAMGAALIV